MRKAFAQRPASKQGGSQAGRQAGRQGGRVQGVWDRGLGRMAEWKGLLWSSMSVWGSAAVCNLPAKSRQVEVDQDSSMNEDMMVTVSSWVAVLYLFQAAR